MAKITNDEELRKYAQKSLKKKQDFREFMIVYAFVTALTVGIWFFTTPTGYFWPIWVIFGMGIAAVLTGLDAAGKLGGKPITSADIDAEVERLKTKR
jgi:2TM domain